MPRRAQRGGVLILVLVILLVWAVGSSMTGRMDRRDPVAEYEEAVRGEQPSWLESLLGTKKQSSLSDEAARQRKKTLVRKDRCEEGSLRACNADGYCDCPIKKGR